MPGLPPFGEASRGVRAYSSSAPSQAAASARTRVAAAASDWPPPTATPSRYAVTGAAGLATPCATSRARSSTTVTSAEPGSRPRSAQTAEVHRSSVLIALTCPLSAILTYPDRTLCESGYHGDQRDQRDQHVAEVGVEAAGLQPLGNTDQRGDGPHRGLVDELLYQLHDIRGVAEMRDGAGSCRGTRFPAALSRLFDPAQFGAGEQDGRKHPAGRVGVAERGVLVGPFDARGRRAPRGYPPDPRHPGPGHRPGEQRDDQQQDRHGDPQPRR